MKKNEKRYYLFMCLIGLGELVYTLSLPILIQYSIDSLYSGSINGIISYILYSAVILSVVCFISYNYNIQYKFKMMIKRNITYLLINKLFYVNPQLFKEKGVGYFTNLFSNTTTDFSEFRLSFIKLVISSVIVSAFFSYIVIGIQWRMLAFLILLVFLGYINNLILKKVSTHSENKYKVVDELSNMNSMMLDGYTAIKTNKMEEWFIKKYKGSLGQCTKMEMLLNLYEYYSDLINEFYQILRNISLPLFGIYLLNRTDITVGGIIALTVYFRNIDDQIINGLIGNLRRIILLYPSKNRIYDISHNHETYRNNNLQYKYKEEKDKSEDIIIKNLSYQYSKDNTCIKIDEMKLKNKSINVLTGHSGSGKSTLCNIIAGFLDIQAGQIIKYTNSNQVQTLKISYCNNEIKLINNLSYYENLKLSNHELSRNDILKEVENIGLKYFVDSLENGIDTIVTDNPPSKGIENLWISLRAFLSNCDLIILDEVTAGLSTKLKEKFYNRLKSKGKTILLVSHDIYFHNIADNLIIIDSKDY